MDAIFNCMTTIILSQEAFDAPDMQRETEAFIDWCKRSPHDPDAPILARASGKRLTASSVWRRGYRWTPAAGRRFAAAEEVGLPADTLAQLRQKLA